MHDLANERVAHSQHRDALSLGDYLRVVRRRRLTIALVTVVSVIATYAYTQHQVVLYQSQAGVLLSRQSLVTAITGVVDPTSNAQPDRVAQTQADVARSPEVAKAVLTQLTPKYPQLAHWTPGQLLGTTTAAPESGADLLIFQATNHNPSLARDLVNAYALQYTKYREQLDNDAVKAAIVRIQSTLATTTSKTLVAKLQQKMQDLLTIASLQSGNTRLVTPAEGASQIQPKTFRTVLLGLGFGLIFGVVLRVRPRSARYARAHRFRGGRTARPSCAGTACGASAGSAKAGQPGDAGRHRPSLPPRRSGSCGRTSISPTCARTHRRS